MSCRGGSAVSRTLDRADWSNSTLVREDADVPVVRRRPMPPAPLPADRRREGCAMNGRSRPAGSGEAHAFGARRCTRRGPGDLYVVPRGVEHCPVAEEEVHLLIIEPAGTPNTGDESTAVHKEVI